MESARWTTGRNVLVLAALISIIGCIAGYVKDPARFFHSYLVAFTFTCAIGLGAFFFVQVQYSDRLGLERDHAPHHGKHHDHAAGGAAAVRAAGVRTEITFIPGPIRRSSRPAKVLRSQIQIT